MTGARPQSPLDFMLMASGIIVAIVVAITMVRLSQRAELPFDSAKDNPIVPPEFGVVGVIRANGASVDYRNSTLDLQSIPGEIDDPALPDQPFEGEFTFTFDRGRAEFARIGAEIQGGSLIIMHRGEVLLSDYAAPDAAKLVLTRIPLQLARRREQIIYIFKTDAQGPVKLRAMWQPEDEEAPRAMGALRSNGESARR